MAAAHPLSILGAVPGRVLKGITGFTSAPDYGGTNLGDLKRCRWRRTEVRKRHTAEEFGGRVMGAIVLGEAFSLVFALRGLDDDAAAALFPLTRVGAKSQKRVIYGGTRGGALVETTQAVALMFVPDDVQNHPAVLLPRAIPWPDPITEADLHLEGEHLIGSSWLALPGANGLPYEVGPLVDFTAL